VTTVQDGTPPGLSGVKRDLLARRLQQRSVSDVTVIPRLPDGAERPLSYAQERLWFMEQAMAAGTAAYTISLLIYLDGELDEGALRRSLENVAARHETLRSRIFMTDDGRPRISVTPEPDVPLRTVDVSEMVDPDAALDSLVEAEADKPFDIAREPLLRGLLVRFRPERHALLVVVHHAVMDGWSTDLLVTELRQSYMDIVAGRPVSLPPLAVQYGDYAAWQRARLVGPVLAGDLDYWRGQLSGLPPLVLPTDRPRPAQQTFTGAGLRFRLDSDLVARLTQLGSAHGATLYMTLLAVYSALLHRYTGQDDFAVGSPVAGRIRPELEPLVGMFANVLTLRARISGAETFAQVLDDTRRTALEAMAHQEVPFEKIVADLNVPRDLSRSPLFQATFALQNYRVTASDGDTPSPLAVSWHSLVPRTTRFDLEWYAFTTPEGMDCLLLYNDQLYEAQTVQRFAGHLESLAQAVVRAPLTAVRDLDLLSPEEHVRVAEGWSDGATVDVAPSTVAQLVAAQVARTPDAIAVTDETGQLTYAELDRWATTLAGALDAGPGDVVGVCLPRSLAVSVATLAVLKAGAAYLPLDASYPADRLTFMLTDAKVSTVIMDAAGTLVVPDGIRVLHPDAAGPGTALTPARPDDAAYLIYTSGSTGRPKGVVNTHRGIVNRLDWMQRTFGLTAGDVVLQKTPVSFDVSVWELFWPLITGARLVYAKPDGHRDPEYLAELIDRAGVTTIHFVPSMLSAMLMAGALERCTSLRRVICSGEALPAQLARDTVATLPQAGLHNLYGPTEAAIDVSWWPCEPEVLDGLGRVPIGTPIQNMRMYVLDTQGRPAPPGVPGELHLGGVGVARGYHGRPGLTAQRFVPDPFGPPGGRLYRTGDLVRWRSDGAVDYLGRLDHQVKLRGQRIELGEIEAVLRDCSGVRDAVAVVREDTPGDQRIAAYVVLDATSESTVDTWRAALVKALPEYMVPTTLTVLEALPVTANGKLDRAALPAPAAPSRTATEYAEPATATERLIADIWAQVLGVERVGRDDDFFVLGGHSLLAVQVAARLRKATGTGRVAVLDLFTNKTVRALAALLDKPDGAPRKLLAELTNGKGAPVTLTYVCIPYGGGSAAVYQPLADALPAGNALQAVAMPGHDIGLDDIGLPFEELARRCADEIRSTVTGPLVLYGHCGVGGALTVAVAQLLRAADRPIEAVYLGAIFPFARPRGMWRMLANVKVLDRLRSNRLHINWLTSLGVNLDDIDPDQANRIVTAIRRDEKGAENYFTGLLDRGAVPLDCPVISVVGERDTITDFYQERYREWSFLSPTNAVVLLEEAGHYFLKYRADELAEIVTGTHRAVRAGQTDALTVDERGPDAGWWLKGLSDPTTEATTPPPTRPVVRPGMPRFLAVAGGQLVSMIGSALTQWAIPLYVYLSSHSVLQFGLLAVTSLVPGLLVSPLAGAVVDRYNRRTVMLLGDAGSAIVQCGLLLLIWSGQLQLWNIYPLIVCLAISTTFQRLSYGSAVAQLVPKRYLGHAIGLNQFASGTAQTLVPLVAAGLLATIGLRGIVGIDVVSYIIAIAVVAMVRFPATMAWRREETLVKEITEGVRYSWRRPGLRGMLLYFAVVNIFLAVPLMAISPLILSMGTVDDVARIAFLSALGTVGAAMVIVAWGGPRRRRMRGVLLASIAMGLTAVLSGAHASLVLVAIGEIGLAAALTIVNGIYTMIIQVKTPQRFHGRVFALNQMLAWSTLPIGFGVVGPVVIGIFEPLMAKGGALSGSVGALIGTGPGRGIALADILAGLAIVVLAVGASFTRTLARFDETMPDATPDDLIGAQERTRRHASPALATAGSER
jgi:amino acid adenylation domain-containing protein